MTSMSACCRSPCTSPAVFRGSAGPLPAGAGAGAGAGGEGWPVVPAGAEGRLIGVDGVDDVDDGVDGDDGLLGIWRLGAAGTFGPPAAFGDPLSFRSFPPRIRAPTRTIPRTAPPMTRCFRCIMVALRGCRMSDASGRVEPAWEAQRFVRPRVDEHRFLRHRVRIAAPRLVVSRVER